MNYISTPLSFQDAESSIMINRDIHDREVLINNLLELIVFTPKGSFPGDPDFGFEYWDYEYSNVFERDFNNGSTGLFADKRNKKITQEACQESIRKSLTTYAPHLKNVKITIELNAAEVSKQKRKKIFSQHQVIISIEGDLEDDIGTTTPYRKEIKFHVEPTVKQAIL